MSEFLVVAAVVAASTAYLVWRLARGANSSKGPCARGCGNASAGGGAERPAGRRELIQIGGVSAEKRP